MATNVRRLPAFEQDGDILAAIRSDHLDAAHFKHDAAPVLINAIDLCLLKTLIPAKSLEFWDHALMSPACVSPSSDPSFLLLPAESVVGRLWN